MNNNNSVFSFFSGAGMLDLGFEDEGFKTVFVNELDSSFLSAYQHSRKAMGGYDIPKYGYHNNSIDNFLGDKLDQLKKFVSAEKQEGKIVGFIGGPP